MHLAGTHVDLMGLSPPIFSVQKYSKLTLQCLLLSLGSSKVRGVSQLKVNVEIEPYLALNKPRMVTVTDSVCFQNLMGVRRVTKLKNSDMD